MAHKKGQGSTRNGCDSQPKYRGVKRFEGQVVLAGPRGPPVSLLTTGEQGASLRTPLLRQARPIAIGGEVDRVYGLPHRALSRKLREQRRDEPGENENGFESLGAEAELDQVIFDGSSFGTAAPAGSEEEADYLGIPGLLDATQMRDLLSRRQDE